MWVSIEPELYPTCNASFRSPVNVVVMLELAIVLHLTAAGFGRCCRLCEAAQLLALEAEPPRLRLAHQLSCWHVSSRTP
jgi:hypothetical protein